MRVALVNVLVDDRASVVEEGELVIPLNLGYLSAYLRHHGMIADLFDCSAYTGDEERFIRLHGIQDYDVVGLTTYTPGFSRVSSFARALKALSPGVFVVLGGPHVSAVPLETLRDVKEADAVICYEGEETLRELVEALPAGTVDALSSIAALAYRDPRRGPVLNSPRPRASDLDSLPFPDRTLNGRYQPFATKRLFMNGTETVLRDFPVHSSRGCPFSCSYCAISSCSADRRWRARSVSNVLQEIASHFERSRFDLVNFSDPNFFVDPERALHIGEGIKRIDPELRWCFQTRPDLIVRSRAYLRGLKVSGCAFIHLGVENMTPTFLSDYHRGATPDHNAVATALLKRHRLLGRVYMVLFHEKLRLSDFRANLRFLDAHTANSSTAEMLGYQVELIAFPGTPIFEQIRTANVRCDVHQAQALPIRDPKARTLRDLVKGFFETYFAAVRNTERRIRETLLLADSLRADDARAGASPTDLLADLQRLVLDRVEILNWHRDYIRLALEAVATGNGKPLEARADEYHIRLGEIRDLCDDVRDRARWRGA
jgi:radical SAM superfamily enzyme YgiQ (UPF0313 family)